jgi:hypothetical protein
VTLPAFSSAAAFWPHAPSIGSKTAARNATITAVIAARITFMGFPFSMWAGVPLMEGVSQSRYPRLLLLRGANNSERMVEIFREDELPVTLVIDVDSLDELSALYNG